MTQRTNTPAGRDTLPLSRFHAEELLTASAIDPEVARQRGYATVDHERTGTNVIPGVDALGHPSELLKRLGFPTWATKEPYYYPGLWIPMWSPTGTRSAGQFKPKSPVPNREGKRMKYASAKGVSRLDVHPRWTVLGDEIVPPIRDPERPLWITEGIKKADALTSRGAITVGLLGVYNWRNQYGTLGDWEDVRIKGREIVICFDADTMTKPAIQAAMVRLGKWLRSKGAGKVRYLVTPASVNDHQVKGCDDYFAAGGTLTELLAHATDKPPRTAEAPDAFTDARLADTLADAVLIDSYSRTEALGWMRYDGRRWTPCPEGEVVEAVRQYVVAQYMEALDAERERIGAGQESDSGAVEGWRKMHGAGRIRAVLSLAGNVAGVLRDASEFDTDPDLLNTPTGVIDLLRDEIMPHSPDFLMTKITSVGYDPDAEHKAWSAALEAVPMDALDWLQTRLGQATTGHHPDDERTVLLTGGGSNGKTSIMDTVFCALGDYAAAIPNALLLTNTHNPGAASPEKMSLMGVRLAYIEETPEGRHLDTQALKEITGTPTIKARRLYHDYVTFRASHSLFLNTNYAPRVAETDNGTWRRLVRVDFPYRYRKPHEPLEADTDRRGDPALKRNLTTVGAREAALAWLVRGARAWYAADQCLAAAEDPAIVVDATRRWRHQSDLILRFMDECLEFDRERWVPTTVVYNRFSEWVRANGHRDIPSNTFLERITAHTELPAYVTVRQVVRESTPGISLPPVTWAGAEKLGKRVRAVLGMKFPDLQ